MNDFEIDAIAILQPDLEAESYRVVGRLYLDPLQVDYHGQRDRVEGMLRSMKHKLELNLHPTATDTTELEDQDYSIDDYINGLNHVFNTRLETVDTPSAFADRGQDNLVESFKETHDISRFD